MASLEQILQSRDRRSEHQRSLMERFGAGSAAAPTLLCLTVSLPGPVKRDVRSACIVEAALSLMRAQGGTWLRYEELSDLETGFEGYWIVDLPPREVKQRCCEWEETHPLGRLMDWDVLVWDGSLHRPLSRSELGQEERRCLLCERAARDCMRAARHSAAELSAAIDARLSAYKEILKVDAGKASAL